MSALQLTCPPSLVDAAGAGMRRQMAAKMNAVTRCATADLGGTIGVPPEPMIGTLAVLDTELDLIEVPVLLADGPGELSGLRSMIGDFSTRLSAIQTMDEGAALAIIMTAYVSLAQITGPTFEQLSEHVRPTGIRLKKVPVTAARFRALSMLFAARGLTADTMKHLRALDDDTIEAESQKALLDLDKAGTSSSADFPPAAEFGDLEPWAGFWQACPTQGRLPRETRLETLVAFELMLVAEAKRSPGVVQYEEYMGNRHRAIVGLLQKDSMDVITPSYSFSVESSRRSGVSGHLRELYLDLLSTAASSTRSAALSQSASWTLSTLAFTGMTPVSVTLLHIVRPCPEVLGWPMVANEALCLERGMTQCFAPQWAESGSRGAGWRWPYSHYLRLPGSEQLSWSRLNRLAQAAIIIAGTLSPTLRKVTMTAGGKQLRKPDRWTNALMDYVNKKTGTASVILAPPSASRGSDQDRALEEALRLADVNRATAPLPRIEDVTEEAEAPIATE